MGQDFEAPSGCSEVTFDLGFHQFKNGVSFLDFWLVLGEFIHLFNRWLV